MVGMAQPFLRLHLRVAPCPAFLQGQSLPWARRRGGDFDSRRPAATRLPTLCLSFCLSVPPWLRVEFLLPHERAPPAAIIKNCAHVYEATDPFHHSSTHPPQRQRGSCRRRTSHARRVRHQTHREKNPPPLQRQDP